MKEKIDNMMEDTMPIESNENIQYVINLENKIKELEDNLKKEEEKYLYLLSDMSNMKRQYENRLAKIETETTEKVVCKFMDILDDINILISSVKTTNNTFEEVDYQAMVLISKNIYKLLESYNIKELNPVGETFNEKTMNAISVVSSEDPSQIGTIANVYKKGYYNTKTDRTIRYADVIVFN